MHDRIPEGLCSGLCDLFKVWKIADTLLETMHNRDVVTTEYRSLIGSVRHRKDNTPCNESLEYMAVSMKNVGMM